MGKQKEDSQHAARDSDYELADHGTRALVDLINRAYQSMISAVWLSDEGKREANDTIDALMAVLEDFHRPGGYRE